MTAMKWTEIAMGLMAVGTVLEMLRRAGRHLVRTFSTWVTRQVFPRVDALTQSLQDLSEQVEASGKSFDAFASEQRAWNASQLQHNEWTARRLGRIEGRLEVLGHAPLDDTDEHEAAAPTEGA